MNKQVLSKLLIICAVIFSSTSCSDDKKEPTPGISEPTPGISSLSASKTTDIIFGETVMLTASSTGDVFEWSSSGGSLVNDGSTANWIAPNKVGVYSVSASNGQGNAQTQNLEVVGKFFFPFDKTYANWSYDLNTTNREINNGILEVSSSDGTSVSIYGFIPEENISLPYSLKTTVALKADDWANIANTNAVNFFIYLKPTGEAIYTRSLQLQIAPKARRWTLYANETDGTQNRLGRISDIDVFAEANQFRTISMSVTADKQLIVNIDKAEVARIDLSTLGNELILERFAYRTTADMTILIDDFYLTTDDTILK